MHPTNDATRWRLALARRIAAAYAINPEVQAIVVNGSVGRGWADAYSDIEISVFWSRPPTEEQRRDAAERAGGTQIELWPLYEPDEELSGEYAVSGVPIGMNEFTVETIERFLDDVIDRYDTADYKQILIANVVHSTPVYGIDLVERWQARAARYPDDLARAMVREHVDFDLGSAEMLAARDDLLMLYDLFVRTERQLLGVLLGLNRVYLDNPRFKWMDRLIAQFQIAPPDLASRLKQVLRGDLGAAVDELQQLVDEVFGLINAHMPEIDTSAEQANARHRRAVVEPPSTH